MQTSIKNTGWRKYTQIIVAIILLFIVTLSIIFMSYYNTRLANQNTAQINLTARLTTVTQEIKNNVFNIDIYAKELMIRQNQPDVTEREKAELLQNIDIRTQQLEQSITQFNQILDILEKGGSSASLDILDFVTPLDSTSNIKLLHAIDTIWQPYHRLINNFNGSLIENKLNTHAINYATDYARIFNDRLSALSEKITENLSTKARHNSQMARIGLIIGFILSILITVYLIFIAFRQLVQTDHRLAHSQRELNDIMDTITEGLFLVDKNLQIGEQHSKELEKMLHVTDFAHKPLTEILKDKVTPKVLSTTSGFLEQLFRKKIYDDLIESLNPLNKVQIVTENEEIKDIRYLSFSFRRVFEGKKISHILVIVRDITENVLLEQRLEQERVESDARMQMLSYILQVDNDLMADFLEHVHTCCRNVNNILKTSGSDSSNLKDKIKQISRMIHSIKGEASALGLSQFTIKVEQFENDIAQINQKPDITGNDFLGLTMRLDELLTIYEKTNDLFVKLTSGKLKSDDMETDALTGLLSRFANQIAQRNGHKKVQVKSIGLDQATLSHEQMGYLRELSLQLLRNAIVHGIETPQERINIGKNEAGQITVQLARSENNWLFAFSDDGRGIDYEALRHLAMKLDKYKHRDPQTLTTQELLGVMFESGTSTAKNINEDAGRGVGMDVIRTAIIHLHGKLNIHSVTGKITRFTIKFPVEELK